MPINTAYISSNPSTYQAFSQSSLVENVFQFLPFEDLANCRSLTTHYYRLIEINDRLQMNYLAGYIRRFICKLPQTSEKVHAALEWSYFSDYQEMLDFAKQVAREKRESERMNSEDPEESSELWLEMIRREAKENPSAALQSLRELSENEYIGMGMLHILSHLLKRDEDNTHLILNAIQTIFSANIEYIILSACKKYCFSALKRKKNLSFFSEHTYLTLYDQLSAKERIRVDLLKIELDFDDHSLRELEQRLCKTPIKIEALKSKIWKKVLYLKLLHNRTHDIKKTLEHITYPRDKAKAYFEIFMQDPSRQNLDNLSTAISDLDPLSAASSWTRVAVHVDQQGHARNDPDTKESFCGYARDCANQVDDPEDQIQALINLYGISRDQQDLARAKESIGSLNHQGIRLLFWAKLAKTGNDPQLEERMQLQAKMLPYDLNSFFGLLEKFHYHRHRIGTIAEP